MKLLKSNSIPIRCLLSALVVCLLASSSVNAASVYGAPDDTLSGTNNWLENRTGEPLENEKVFVVTDFNDLEYIYNSGSAQAFTLSNYSASIPNDATIDSFVFHSRAQAGGAGTHTIRHRVRMAPSSANWCDGVNINLTTTWTDYSEKFTLTPTAAGTCAGSLTEARMDSLCVQYNSVSAAVQNRVTQCSVVVWYTPVASTKKRRRRLTPTSEVINGSEKFAEAGGFNIDMVVGFSEPDWIWRTE